MQLKHTVNPTDAGSPAQRVDAAAALDIFERLANATSPATIFDVMIALALQHAGAAEAGIASHGANGYQALAGAAILAREAAIAPTADYPAVFDYNTRTAIVIAFALAGSQRQACLCIVRDTAPAADTLATLTLMARCGASMLASVRMPAPPAAPIWPQRLADLEAENDTLKATADARLSLACRSPNTSPTNADCCARSSTICRTRFM